MSATLSHKTRSRGRRTGGSYRPIADINVTPMVDVMLVLLVIFRDVVIFLGAVAYHFVTHELEMRPLMSSKVSTALQIVLVILVAVNLAYANIPPWIFNAMIVLVASFTIISGINYVVLWSGYTMQIKSKK